MGSEIMDYIDTLLTPRVQDHEFEQTVNLIEAYLYLADQWSTAFVRSKSSALDQLELLQGDSQELTHPEHLSERTRKSGSQRASNLLEILKRDRMGRSGDIKSYLGGLINLH